MTPQQRVIEYAPKLLVRKPTILITEEGENIQIEMPELTTIKQKRHADDH